MEYQGKEFPNLRKNLKSKNYNFQITDLNIKYCMNNDNLFDTKRV